MINDIATSESVAFKSPKGTFTKKTSSTAHVFDHFMVDSENRSRETTQRSREPRERDRNDRSERVTMLSDNKEQSTSLNDEVMNGECDQVTETTQPTEVNDQELGQNEEIVDDELQEAVVYALAEALYVSPEIVYETLKEIEAEPKDLAEPIVANKYLQATLKIETPAEVLVIPEYQETLKQVVDAVVEIIETTDLTETVKPALDKLTGLATYVDENDQLVVVEKVAELLEEEISYNILERNDRHENSHETVTFTDNQNEQVYNEELKPVAVEGSDVLLSNNQFADINPQVAPAATLTAQVLASNEVIQEARVDTTSVLEQIMTRVKTVSSLENFAELRIKLSPENLGDVSLRIAVQNGIVTAMFVAENQRIKEIIEANFNALRDALAEQGIEVGDLYVSVDGNDAESQMQQMLKAQQEAMRRLQRVSGLVESTEEEPESELEIQLGDNTVEFTA